MAAAEQRKSSFHGSVAPLETDNVNVDLEDDRPGELRRSEGETIEANGDDSVGQTTHGQRNKYNSMRRQDLIDLHLTLSRRREEMLAQLTNISNVILELAESYHDLKNNGCSPCYLCELDLLVQESLAAYDRRLQSTNETVREWSDLISNEAASKKRQRATIIAEQPKSRFTDLYAIPIRQLRNEVFDLESDIEIYRKRIALDDKKIRTMGQRWARDKRGLCCLRYFFLKEIVEYAITDYRIDHR